MRRFAFVLTCLLGLWSCNGGKKDKFEVTKSNRIFDNADLLTSSQEDSIFYLIENLDKEIGSQIAIITIDTLNGVGINEYSINQIEKLDLGRDKQKDGLLITVAHKDHSMRIEVGYGLERIIKDEISGRINRNVMAPKFREGKFGPRHL